jgi:hypothetical protein
VVTYGTRLRGRLQWYGRVEGHVIGPGRHKLRLVAEDLAGNRSAPTPVVFVRVRRP